MRSMRMKSLGFSALLAAIGSVAVAVPQHGSAPAEAASFAPTRFSVVVRGSGPDVILIPGLTASRDIWDAVTVPGYRYHLVQVAGFAGEPARGNARGPIVAGVAEELSRYIAASGLRQPAVIGHSMGGTIAMMIAARHPDQVGRVMVVDMLPQPSNLFGSSPDDASRLANTLANITGSPNGYGFIGSLVTSFGGTDSDPQVVGRSLEELAQTDLTAELPHIRAPLTVVYAVIDRSRRAETIRTFAAAYRGRPGAHLVPVDDSGHMIMFDQPAKLRAAMAAFLKR